MPQTDSVLSNTVQTIIIKTRSAQATKTILCAFNQRAKIGEQMPAKNPKCYFELLSCMLVVNLSAFTRVIMHSKQYGRFLV